MLDPQYTLEAQAVCGKFPFYLTIRNRFKRDDMCHYFCFHHSPLLLAREKHWISTHYADYERA